VVEKFGKLPSKFLVGQQCHKPSAAAGWSQLHSNLYPNLPYVHSCSAQNCNNVTTNSPKRELAYLLAEHITDLALSHNRL
jgi:hypothetical protein